ncbi:DNA-binding response regulator [Geminocystis sp. CENA526]|uniref:DNA-binding response regulator n=1 Tax=Geminocystis sp. CENA526 TaxID=1355871 RepID=UPI003D6E23BA
MTEISNEKNYIFYIVEDHPEVAENNCIFIRKKYPSAYCLILNHPQKLLERLKLEIPSLIVLDLQFGNINGVQSTTCTLDTLEILFRQYPNLNILIYSSEHSYLRPYLSKISHHQGGFAVVPKISLRSAFLEGINNALQGLLSLPPDLRDNLQLNSVELQIVQLLCKESLQDKEIALQLNISPRTIQKHIENIKVKLRLDLLNKDTTNQRVALCMEALKRKLIAL